MRDIVERLSSKEPLCWQDVKEAREEILRLRRLLTKAEDAVLAYDPFEDPFE